MGPNDGWQCDSNSAQEKRTALRCCCLWISVFSHVHMFTYLFVQFGFFRTCVFALRLRYALPFMARFPATHDG